MAQIRDPVSIQCIPSRTVARSSLALAACLLATSQACAEGWGGALGFANDNVYRGISLTAGRPAWLADLHYEFGTDWVIGLGGSAERPPRRSASAQVSAYIDRRWQLNEDWAAKVGAIHYDSAGQGCPSAVSAGCAGTAAGQGCPSAVSAGDGMDAGGRATHGVVAGCAGTAAGQGCPSAVSAGCAGTAAGQGCPSAVSAGDGMDAGGRATHGAVAGCAGTAGRYSYDELNAAIGYRGRWRASIALSPNAGASYAARQVRSGFGAWAELTYHQPIVDRFSADIGIGYAELTQRGVRNYRYGSAGFSYRVGDAYLYLARVWTSPLIGAYPDNPYSATSPVRARWIASVIWSFQGS